jgi:hypothetical protein
MRIVFAFKGTSGIRQDELAQFHAAKGKDAIGDSLNVICRPFIMMTSRQ